MNDPGEKLIRAAGLLHEKGGPSGEDIALPAQFLYDAKGNVVWKFNSKRVNERAEPSVILEHVRKL